MADLHVPKLETFDIAASANVDPKGYVRDVDVFEVHPHGLYMARGADHPQFGHLESWLLPSLGLRANIFHFRPGVEATSRRYLDVAEVTHDESGVWRTRDLYLDLLVLDGAARVDDSGRDRGGELIGVVDAWLAAAGCPVTWADAVTLAVPDQPHPKRVAIGAGPGDEAV